MKRITRLVFFAVFGSALLLAPILAWETDRNMVRRWIYPIKARVVAASTQCDSHAPQWLIGTINTLAQQFDSPANQLLYWPHTASEPFGCVNGWTGTPITNARITPDTRFRYASLSKAVVFIGLLTPPSHTLKNGTEPAAPSPAQTPFLQWLDTPIAPLFIGQEKKPLDQRVNLIRVRHLLNHSAGFDRIKNPDPMLIRNTKPWCPHSPQTLAKEPLQFIPGTRYVYANVGYCLAALAYTKINDQEFEKHLVSDLNLDKYKISFIDQEDSAVEYNFMHQDFYGPDFKKYFDWPSLRTSMGMAGSAKGLAQFLRDNWKTLTLFKDLKDTSIPCDPTKINSCYDGIMERQAINGKTVWSQHGYLPGMGAIILTDDSGNLLVWLGAGVSKNRIDNLNYLKKQFLANNRN